MVVCRFFMQGNCRYGNKCFNEHPSGGSQGYSVTAQRQLFGSGRNQNQRVSFRDSFTPNQNPYRWIAPDAQQQQSRATVTQTGPLSTSDIVKSLAVEVEQTWEGGKIWPFSCLGFEKDYPCLPGFTDMSYDELRYEAYEAGKQGAFDTYVQKVLSLFHEVDLRRQELKNPSMTLKQKLISFIEDCRKKKQASSSHQMALFSDSSLFGQNSSTQPSTGLFGKQSSGFGQQASSQSAFGQSGNQAIFGQTGTQSVFGQQSQTNSGGFGQSSAFGQSSSVFGQSASGFSQPSSGNTSIFGQPVQQSSDSPQTPKIALFGKPPQFGAPGGLTESSGTFGSSSQPSAPTQNPFGTSPVVPSGSSFGLASANQAQAATFPSSTGESSVYTPLDKLTAEELEQFKAATFTVGLIPTKPPPKELCF